MTVEEAPYRPAWLDSIGFVVLLVAAEAMWLYFLVAAVSRDAYGIAALDALLFLGNGWSILRILRRRTRGS
jgi:hypothetical protein